MKTVSGNGSADIDLRNPIVAGVLAWLVPGLGHYYQKRTAKAVLFFLCIVPLLIAGGMLGSSSKVGIARNIYFSWRIDDRRWFFFPQVFIGTVSLPAAFQALQLHNGQQPIFGTFMTAGKLDDRDRTGLAPTIREIQTELPYFELGTYLLAIAGLMNLLVIFDACEGPHKQPPLKKPADKAG